MPIPPYYFPVYPRHLRLPEPGLHAHPLVQSPPLPHVEGLHPVAWISSEKAQLSKTVRGDGCEFVLRNHDSGKLIPHLPIPATIGPYLGETWAKSRYVILHHQPKVLIDGAPAGVFFWTIAPPWRCAELPVPFPPALRALAERGLARRAAAARRLSAPAAPELAAPEQKRLRDSATASTYAEACDAAAVASDELGRARAKRRAWARSERQQRALQRQSEARLRANPGDEAVLAEVQKRRELADAAREESDALRREEREARRQVGRSRVDRERAARQYRQAKPGKKDNPYQAARGVGNVPTLLPSLLGHVPVPATVQLQVSLATILETVVRGTLALALDYVKAYVGLVFDAILPESAERIPSFVMGIAKSLVNEALLGGAQKLLLEDAATVVVSTKFGAHKVKLEAKMGRNSGELTWGLKGAVEAPVGGTKAAMELGVSGRGHEVTGAKWGVKHGEDLREKKLEAAWARDSAGAPSTHGLSPRASSPQTLSPRASSPRASSPRVSSSGAAPAGAESTCVPSAGDESACAQSTGASSVRDRVSVNVEGGPFKVGTERTIATEGATPQASSALKVDGAARTTPAAVERLGQVPVDYALTAPTLIP